MNSGNKQIYWLLCQWIIRFFYSPEKIQTMAKNSPMKEKYKDGRKQVDPSFNNLKEYRAKDNSVRLRNRWRIPWRLQAGYLFLLSKSMKPVIFISIFVWKWMECWKVGWYLKALPWIRKIKDWLYRQKIIFELCTLWGSYTRRQLWSRYSGNMG